MSALCFLQKKQSKGYGVRDDEAEKEGFLRLISAMRACAPHCALGLIRRSRLLKTLHCSVFSSHTLGRSFKSLPSGNTTKKDTEWCLFSWRRRRDLFCASASPYLRSALHAAACDAKPGAGKSNTVAFSFPPFKSLPSGKSHEKRPQMRSFFVAEKEGFEPSRQSPQPTPLAGEPLTATWVLLHSMLLFGMPKSSVWRRERDSNPRCLAASPVFKTGSINHSDISPDAAFTL